MFHVRRRPADSHPRRRKKKPLGVSNGSNNVSVEREGPMLVEITHSGDGGRRVKLGAEPIEVSSTIYRFSFFFRFPTAHTQTKMTEKWWFIDSIWIDFITITIVNFEWQICQYVNVASFYAMRHFDFSHIIDDEARCVCTVNAHHQIHSTEILTYKIICKYFYFRLGRPIRIHYSYSVHQFNRDIVWYHFWKAFAPWRHYMPMHWPSLMAITFSNPLFYTWVNGLFLLSHTNLFVEEFRCRNDYFWSRSDQIAESGDSV